MKESNSLKSSEYSMAWGGDVKERDIYFSVLQKGWQEAVKILSVIKNPLYQLNPFIHNGGSKS